MRLQFKYRSSGQPVDDLIRDHARAAWAEFEELRVSRSMAEYVEATCKAIQILDRWELIAGATHEGPTVVAVLATDEDPHVGPCVSVVLQHASSPYTGNTINIPRAVLRAARILAKGLGIRTIAWTHRDGPWRYKTLYRRVS